MKNIFLFILISFCLISCSPHFIPKNQDNIINQKVDNYDKNMGYIAFSTVCTGINEGAHLFYTKKNANLLEKFYGSRLGIVCGTDEPHYQLLKLPVSTSAFYRFELIEQDQYININKSFNVVPGKVVYLGRLNFKNTSYKSFPFGGMVADKCTFSISDKSDEDLSWFYENYKQIPKSMYLKGVL